MGTLAEWWSWAWDSTSWCPRTACGEWPKWLILMHQWSDEAIWWAYVAIPLVILSFLIFKRKRVPYPLMGVCFAAFIFSCGYGHKVETYMFDTPVYRWSGVVKLFTATVSWGTVIALVYVMPRVVTLKTASECQEEATREIERATYRLKEAVHLNQMILDNAGSAIFLLGLDCRVQTLNSVARDLFGFSKEEFEGKVVHEAIHHTHSDGRPYPMCDCPLGKVLDQSKPLIGHEDVFWTKDGRQIPVLVNFMPVVDDKGTVTNLVLSAQDITVRKMYEKEIADREEDLVKARNDAEAATVAKDQFLAILSHELRTPLTPCLLTASSMAMDPSTSDECRKAFSNIQRNLELEARLIDDLLDIMLIVKGKMSFHMTVIDAHHKIDLAADICRPDLVDKKISLELQLEAEQHHVNADAARFQQVIWNLIKNAVKFTPMEGTIRVQTYNKGEDLVVEVSDTGIGIKAEILPTIFEAFQQGERNKGRKYGGLGLGLAISKAIVQGHKGTLEASSDGEGKGALFVATFHTTYIPSLNPPVFDQPIESKEECSIFYVEDDLTTRQVTAQLLELSGYKVTTASSLREALEIDCTQFNVLVSDIGLGDGTGLELMSNIRHRGCDLPGLALSGYGTEEDVQHSLDIGFAEHLTKPVAFPTLVAAIRRIARRR